MENPTYVHSLDATKDFKPDFYVEMNEKIMKKKIEVFKKCFPTQIRNEQNCLSAEGIISWSRYRGIESRCKYAEAFKTYKRII